MITVHKQNHVITDSEEKRRVGTLGINGGRVRRKVSRSSLAIEAGLTLRGSKEEQILKKENGM